MKASHVLLAVALVAFVSPVNGRILHDHRDGLNRDMWRAQGDIDGSPGQRRHLSEEFPEDDFESTPASTMSGTDSDTHGCRASIGEVWCASSGSCMFAWEYDCPDSDESKETGDSIFHDSMDATTRPVQDFNGQRLRDEDLDTEKELTPSSLMHMMPMMPMMNPSPDSPTSMPTQTTPTPDDSVDTADEGTPYADDSTATPMAPQRLMEGNNATAPQPTFAQGPTSNTSSSDPRETNATSDSSCPHESWDDMGDSSWTKQHATDAGVQTAAQYVMSSLGHDDEIFRVVMACTKPVAYGTNYSLKIEMQEGSVTALVYQPLNSSGELNYIVSIAYDP